MEQFKNFASSTLNGAINNSVTSLVVIDATKFPSNGNFRIRIDDELIKVTAVSGSTFTIVRGVGAAHADGTPIDHVLTKESLDAFQSDNVSGGARASIITPAKKGRIYFSEDGPYVSLDDGSTILDFGLQYPFIPPNFGSFTWVNQGSVTAVTTRNAIYMHNAAGDTSGYLHALIKSAPTPPYTLTVHGKPLRTGNFYALTGICLGESATGKFETLQLMTAGPNSYIASNKWGAYNSNNGGRNSVIVDDMLPRIEWLQIHYDGTNFTHRYSADGYNFRDLQIIAKNDFFTTGPDQLGLIINVASTSDEIGWFVDHWSET